MRKGAATAEMPVVETLDELAKLVRRRSGLFVRRKIRYRRLPE